MFENPLLFDRIEKAPEKQNEITFEKVQTFFILSIMISWSCWMLLLASAKGVIPLGINMTGDIGGFIVYTVAMSGMLIATIFLAPSGNAIGDLKARLAVLGNWKKNLHWYPVAILIPLVAELLAPGVYSIAGGCVQGIDLASPDWIQVALLLIVGVYFALVLMLTGPGYLLPLLERADIGRSNASFIATALTLAWLFPMIMLAMTQHMSSATSPFMIEIVPLALMLYWLYYTARTA